MGLLCICLCVLLIASSLPVFTVWLLDRSFHKRTRQCENCGIDLPYYSTDSMCTVCSVGYREDLVLPDQKMIADGDELIDVCERTLDKLSID